MRTWSSRLFFLRYLLLQDSHWKGLSSSSIVLCAGGHRRHCPVSGLVPHRWDELQPPIPALTHTALSHYTAFILQNAVMAVLGLKLAMFIINH